MTIRVQETTIVNYYIQWLGEVIHGVIVKHGINLDICQSNPEYLIDNAHYWIYRGVVISTNMRTETHNLSMDQWIDVDEDRISKAMT
jgi:hypothetical protein